jgi:hypothetical protein
VSELFFRFDRYIVRRIDERDHAYLDTLIAADPDHKDTMSADYFLKLMPGEDAWACEENGKVLLYFKTQTAARISMQFTTDDPEVNREVLTKGMAWLEGMLVQNHFRELLFDSHSRPLRVMVKRRLGFRDSPEELVKTLPAPWSAGAVNERWHHRPTSVEREG